jgi:hypothetical protein
MVRVIAGILPQRSQVRTFIAWGGGFDACTGAILSLTFMSLMFPYLSTEVYSCSGRFGEKWQLVKLATAVGNRPVPGLTT